MPDDLQETIQQLLDGLAAEDPSTLDQLIGLLHDELRLVAHRQRRRWHGDDTLGTTALVNEAYLKLRRQKRIGTASREHFLALASRAMRHILSTYSEQRRTLKRGGGLALVPLDEVELPSVDRTAERHRTADPAAMGAGDGEAILAALEGALRRLEESHARQCRVVECRFYGGLTVEQTAVALGTSPRTVKRDWAFAQAWLKRELGDVI
jgi:RNA polymerase sigma factor (TIGR02999 family)